MPARNTTANSTTNSYVAGWNALSEAPSARTQARFDRYVDAIAYLRDAAMGYWDDEHDDSCWMPLLKALDVAAKYGAGHFRHRTGDGLLEFWIRPDGRPDGRAGRAEP